MCVRECLCVFCVNCEGRVHPSLQAVVGALTESLAGNQRPSGAQAIERNDINQVICILALFGLVREVLVCSFPPCRKKFPPADTSNAAKAYEIGT